MNRTSRTSSLLLATLLILPGCFLTREYRDADIDPTRVEKLVPGTSTARQVVELLGAPAEVVQLGRRSAYRYQHAQEKTALFSMFVISFMNRDTQEDRVWVFFDEEDVLTHVGSTHNAEDAEYSMPWMSHD